MFHYSGELSKTDNHRYLHIVREEAAVIGAGTTNNTTQLVILNISPSYKCQAKNYDMWPRLLFLSFTLDVFPESPTWIPCLSLYINITDKK